ncbi:MAG: hypothetical protein ACUVSW_13855 [Roseiflexus sp.]
MKVRRLGDFLAPFLDSRAPVLFIVASLVLAMLGNALYELVLLMFGERPITLIGIVVGSVLIFPFLVWGVRRAIKGMTEKMQTIEVIPSERIEPHRALILPIGLRLQGPERAILEWHQPGRVLRDCWLILSPQVRRDARSKVSDLTQWLIENNVDVHTIDITDATSLDEMFRATMQALREAHGPVQATPVVVDITGGTAVMSVGMALASRNWNTPVQYYPAAYDREGNVIVDSAKAPKQVRFTGIQEVAL